MTKKFIIITFMLFGVIFASSETKGQTGNAFPLDVVWKTNTYVPPGFNVKPLATPGSVVVLTALTPTQNPAGLEFTWVIEDSSYRGQGPVEQGVGKDVFTLFTQPIVSGFIHKIKVIAANPRTGAEAVAGVEVPLQSPETHLYFDGAGPHARRVAGRFYGSPGTNDTLAAAPFYFNVGAISDLVFGWVFDGRDVPADEEPTVLQLSINENIPAGTERPLSVTVTNRFNDREQARGGSSLFIVPTQ